MTPPPVGTAEYLVGKYFPGQDSVKDRPRPDLRFVEKTEVVAVQSLHRKKAPIPFWAYVCGKTRVHLSLCAIVKRVLDAVGSAGLIVCSAPLLLIVAVAVKLSSPGPVLFRQVRIGLNGRKFVMYKFRTMVDGADAMKASLARHNEAGKILFKIRNDPRITDLGRIMRRTSLDELPQLFNVLKGEMSLVGPRPPVASEVEKYTNKMFERLSVKPGMTGLWQVSGRSEIPHRRAFALDIWYAQRWSFVLDMMILLHTVRAVISRRGAM
jgi:exopolysaccharide biosynthesis polyprenyl glycosylphosphotransferase